MSLQENKKNEITKIINESGVEEGTSCMLIENFNPFFVEAKKMADEAREIKVVSIDEKEKMLKARELRLKLKNIRVSANKKRKDLKEDAIKYGKAIQGVYNVIDYLISPIERHLENQEKFKEIEEEKARKVLLEQRMEELSNLMEFVPGGLPIDIMSNEDYQKILSGAKFQKQEKEKQFLREEKEREEREKKEREEREKKEREERERLRLENEALRKKAQEEQAEKEKIQKELEEKKKLEMEIKRKEKEKADILKKGSDREKLIALASQIDTLDFPIVQSKEAEKIVKEAIEMLGNISSRLKSTF